MLCLLVSGALSYAHGVFGIENTEKEGNPIELIKKTNGGFEKDFPVSAEYDGQWLSVSFAVNVGLAAVEVATSTGALVDHIPTLTPNDVLVYIPSSGNYTVTITLANGDEYYGEFEIIDL